MYKEKYLKYKTKYITLKNQVGGGFKFDVTKVDDFIFSYDDITGIFEISDNNNNKVKVIIEKNMIIINLNNKNAIIFRCEHKYQRVDLMVGQKFESVDLMSIPNIINSTDKNIVNKLIIKSIDIVNNIIIPKAESSDIYVSMLHLIMLPKTLTLFEEILKKIS